MGSLADVRAGLKTRLATIAGLNAHATAPGSIVTPCAFVVPRTPAIEFDETMGRGSDQLNFGIVLLVSRSTDQLAQEHLDPYLAGSGSSSIKAAVEGDGTLGGVADWTRVSSVASYGDIEIATISYLGARFNVEVSVDGS
jgi:hypothetical protein